MLIQEKLANVRGVARCLYDKLDTTHAKVDMKGLLLFVLFLAYFRPREYAIGTLAYNIWQAYLLAASALSILIVLLVFKASRRWIAFACFFTFYYLVSTVLNLNLSYLPNACARFLKCLGFVSLCEFGYQDDPKRTVKSFFVAAGIMCFLHLVTVFVYYDIVGGMRHGWINYEYGYTEATEQNYYLLGYDNISVMYFIPLIAALLCYGFTQRSKGAVACGAAFWVVVFATYVGKSAVTAEIVTGLFAILVVVGLHPGIRAFLCRILTFRNVCIVGIAFCIAIVLGISSTLFREIALSLGKSVTLSGRLGIWTASLKYIKECPLFGYGIEKTTYTVEKITLDHCHNLVLQILYTGGLFALVAFVWVVFQFSRDCGSAMRVSFLVASSALLCFLISTGLDWLADYPVPYFLFYLPLISAELERCAPKVGHTWRFESARENDD